MKIYKSIVAIYSFNLY